ncbi:MAG: glycosyltransferase family 4 protein [Phocaeicola sp.]
MKVLLINTSERTGGAAIAAKRLMKALQKQGVKVQLLVRDKQSQNGRVIQLKKTGWRVWQFVWERIVIWQANHFKKHNLFAVDIANTGCDITQLPEFKQATVIHIHWINQGMLSLKDLERIFQSGKAVVWTMHDMWPFTSICHHSDSCNHYYTHCHDCPLLYKKGGKRDLSYRTFEQKKRIWEPAKLSFVACSHWLKERAVYSALTQGKEVLSIPNPINVELFRKYNSAETRKQLKLPTDKKLLLFGSLKVTDKRKGIDYLVEACKVLTQTDPTSLERWAIVVFGKESAACTSLFPFPVFSLNYIHTEKELVDLYNAVDLFVTPSLQENLPNMIMEAMACGTPCVGFQVGGIPEMIDHLHNGYVAQYKSATDLAQGIRWILDEADYSLLSESARRKVMDCYSESVVAKQYIQLYNQVTASHE